MGKTARLGAPRVGWVQISYGLGGCKQCEVGYPLLFKCNGSHERRSKRPRLHSCEVLAEQRLSGRVIVSEVVRGSEILIRGDELSQLGFTTAITVTRIGMELFRFLPEGAGDLGRRASSFQTQ
jgi:hypothetical protein